MRVLFEQWLAAELETQTSFHSSLLVHLEFFMGFKREKKVSVEETTTTTWKQSPLLIFLNSFKSKRRNVTTLVNCGRFVMHFLYGLGKQLPPSNLLMTPL